MLKLSLIAAASLAAVATAAPAANGERWSDANFVAAANVQVHRGGHFSKQFTDGHGGRHHGDRLRGFPQWESADARDRHRDRHDDGGFFDGGWGYYNPDINRSWDSDSFNDWWHDRPDRAFPRWVKNNRACEADRMWWSGSGWRC